MSDSSALDRIADRVLAYRPVNVERAKEEWMADTYDVEIDGKVHQAFEVDFEIAEEDWNRYNLIDGGTIRTRLSVLRIGKVLDEEGNDLIGPDGRPVYHVEWLQPVIKFSR